MKSHFLEAKNLLFFDDLALYYLLQEVPLSVFAKAFTELDPKLMSTTIKILNPRQREILYLAIQKENHQNQEENRKALEGILLIAGNLIDKGMILKQGIYYYGKKK